MHRISTCSPGPSPHHHQQQQQQHADFGMHQACRQHKQQLHNRQLLDEWDGIRQGEWLRCCCSCGVVVASAVSIPTPASLRCPAALPVVPEQLHSHGLCCCSKTYTLQLSMSTLCTTICHPFLHPSLCCCSTHCHPEAAVQSGPRPPSALHPPQQHAGVAPEGHLLPV
jgi:hypothetical protein